MTEIEVKLELNQENFQKIIDHYKDQIIDTLDQWNIFFETPGSTLRQARKTCRLRRIIHANGNEEWVMTSKHGGGISNGISSHGEIEDNLSKSDAMIILTDPKNAFKHFPQCIKECLNEFSQEEFSPYGDFRSVRRVIPWETLHIEADECYLPNKEKFYEVEIESPDAQNVKTRITQNFASLNIEFHDSTISKLRRLCNINDPHCSTYLTQYKQTI